MSCRRRMGASGVRFDVFCANCVENFLKWLGNGHSPLLAVMVMEQVAGGSGAALA